MKTEGIKRAVLVTGSAGGIGRLVVRGLAQRGWKVYAGVRRVVVGGRFGSDLDDFVQQVPLDLESDESIEALRVRLASELEGQGLAGLVNCAGIIVDGPLELIPAPHFRRQFDVNVTGAFAITRAMLPSLRLARGRIINIGAVSARTTSPFFGPISASKAALASLSDAMRMEFAPFGIDVALIEPGGVETEIWQTSAALQTEGLSRANPDLVAIYRPAMKAMRDAFASFGADKPAVVADAVVRAVHGRARPKPRTLVGKGATFMAMMGRLPIHTRDRMLMNALGLTKTLAVAAKALPALSPTDSDGARR